MRKIVLSSMVGGMVIIGLAVFSYQQWNKKRLKIPQIAIVNIWEVQQKAKPFENFRKLEEAVQKKLYHAFEEKENKLRKEQEELLTAEQNEGTSVKIAKRKQMFAKKVTSLESSAHKQHEKLRKSSQEDNIALQNLLNKVINDIVAQRKLKLIIDSKAILYGQEFDISQVIIDELNKQQISYKLESIKETFN